MDLEQDGILISLRLKDMPPGWFPNAPPECQERQDLMDPKEEYTIRLGREEAAAVHAAVLMICKMRSDEEGRDFKVDKGAILAHLLLLGTATIYLSGGPLFFRGAMAWTKRAFQYLKIEQKEDL
jgi:hypothetical protein